ncbi:helix-turn-helix domain-containing protein [Actinomadura sp. NAK00032]|uniref:helix-turn-helix transcriptional regulator n=1 Tax=Actinomadura sp. NAK00032 TaxID=2742128 RepID=UPI001592519A|nr:helix-turn-helix transcriptional regulator [Actinomadura sp. NAK00032]QKW36720.1 helix-turn-helix domain-containing protein [Actinomadura sp. NAK00032]
MDRRELARFLRGRRERLRPADLGLEAGARRRTPGLRREEVARLAGVSVDHYTRLEQARGSRPSRAVLSSVARALRLTGDERAHLFHLAGEVPRAPGPSADVPANIAHLLDWLDGTPAIVIDAKYDVLAWNALAAALIADFPARPHGRRNLLRCYFTGAEPSWVYEAPGMREFAGACVADLRATAAENPDDPGIAALVAELRERSTEFRALWHAHEVRVQRSMTKQIRHPRAGEMELICTMLHVPERNQRVVLYTAAPGTPSHEALRSLRPAHGPGLGAEARRGA